jgi:hypothetical protein
MMITDLGTNNATGKIEPSQPYVTRVRELGWAVYDFYDPDSPEFGCSHSTTQELRDDLRLQFPGVSDGQLREGLEIARAELDTEYWRVQACVRALEDLIDLVDDAIDEMNTDGTSTAAE